MQAYHRTRHRWIWLILALVTATTLFFALTNNYREAVKELTASATENR